MAFNVRVAIHPLLFLTWVTSSPTAGETASLAGEPVSSQDELDAGSDVNAYDAENLTPLFFAAASGNPQATES